MIHAMARNHAGLNEGNDMKTVTIKHDAFGRFETVRTKAEGECAWCGQPAKFAYGTRNDGVFTKLAMDRKVFCSMPCRMQYFGR
jgi:hypothetical protein